MCDERVRRAVEAGLAASRAGLPLNFDAWDGFPAARRKAAAFVARRGRQSRSCFPATATMPGRSISTSTARRPGSSSPATASPRRDSRAFLPRIRPDDIVRALVARNPQLKWADTSRRGYLTARADPRARDRRMAVPRHGPRTLDPAIRPPPDERGAGRRTGWARVVSHELETPTRAKAGACRSPQLPSAESSKAGLRPSTSSGRTELCFQLDRYTDSGPGGQAAFAMSALISPVASQWAHSSPSCSTASVS